MSGRLAPVHGGPAVTKTTKPPAPLGTEGLSPQIRLAGWPQPPTEIFFMATM